MFARLFSLLILVSTTANAYVPPSAFLVKSWAKKHVGLKAVRVKSVLSTPSNSVHLKITTFVVYPSGTLVSWATDAQDHELMRVVRQHSEFSALNALFFDSNAESMIVSLKAAGLPIQSDADLASLASADDRRKTEVETLKRWKNHAVWVIGKSQDPESPQLWMEKDSFLPLRMIFNSSNGKTYEMQTDEFRFNRDFAYPKTWLLMPAGRSDGSYLFREDISDLSINPDSKSAEYRSLDSSTTQVTTAGQAAPSEVRDLLEKYYGESYGRNR